MEDQTSTNHLETLPLMIHFIPTGPITPATKKAIRSHVTMEARRKKRHQKQLTLLSKPLPTKSKLLEDNICKCFILETSPLVGSSNTPIPTSRSALQRQQVADSYKICLRCHKVQFAALSHPGQLRAAKTYPEVLSLLQVKFDLFDSLPSLPSELSLIDPRELNEVTVHIITFLTPGIVKSKALPIAIRNPALLMALLYMSCSFLSAMKGEGEGRLASILKKEAIRQINHIVKDPRTVYTSEIVSAIGFLSAGNWCFGSPSAIQEIDEYEKGMLSLVPRGPSWTPPIWHFGSSSAIQEVYEDKKGMLSPIHRGPSWTPPESDVFGRVMHKLLVLHAFVHAAVRNTPIKNDLLANYGRIHRPISNSELIAESPLFCPRDDFYSIRSLESCSEGTLRLLQATKFLVDATLEINNRTPGQELELSRRRYETAKTELAVLLSGTRDRMQADSVYESCRLTALIMSRAIDTGTPLKETDKNPMAELRAAMQKTDIGSAWGRMSGVLFWIALVGASAAVIGTPHHSYMESVLRHVYLELTYKSPLFEAMTIACSNFVSIQSSLQGQVRLVETG